MGAAGLAHALHLISCGVVFVPPFIAHGDITLLNRSEENVHRPKHANPIKISRPAVKAITPRQCEVLRLLRQGCTNKTIARELSLSEGAVKFHLAALFRRLGARNRAEAVANGFSYLAQSADTDPQTLHRQ
jgi:DNA-binding NarL/FixJ family response regulator